MIEMIDTGAEEVVGMHITGKVTRDDIDRAIAMLEEKLRSHDWISFAAEIEGLEGISAAALLRDIGYGVQQLPHLHRFHRVAVVTDKKWIRAAVKMEGRVLSGIDVKAFKRGERSEALAWAREVA